MLTAEGFVRLIMIYLEGAICASIDGSLLDCASGHLWVADYQ